MEMQTTITSWAGSANKPYSKIAPAMILSIILALAVFGSVPVFAVDISKGEMDGRLDTTLSYGGTFRVQGRDADLIGVANRPYNDGEGEANSINYDNGNLNYDPGDLVSLALKATHELELSWRQFGFFGRMYYFYDFAVKDISTRRTPLSHAAKRESGGKVKLLDAYVTADVDLLDRPISFRAGNMLLSWGESTFIQNGINVINPVDVSQLRVAGAELREAFLPIPMLAFNADISNNISLEGFYQLHWQQTEIDPEGTFFGAADHAGPGGSRVFLGFGRSPDDPDRPGPMDYPQTPYGDMPPIGGSVPRDNDLDPSNQGQGGAALHYFAPSLNDTEFGLFYIHYHSRKPLLSGRTAPAPDFPAIPTNVSEVLQLVEFGLFDGDAAGDSWYFREYPENINLLGASFNTDISPVGLALQGEISCRFGQPLQVDDAELLFSALSPLDPYLQTLRLIEHDPAVLLEMLTGTFDPSNYPQLQGDIFGRSQLGAAEFDQHVVGYRRKEVVQAQFTLTKVFGPTLGADQIVLLGEIGATWILGMEDPSELRYEGPGTFTSGNDWYTQTGLQPETQTEGFADPFSMGYRIASRADFNNAIGAWNIQPAIALAHDVVGTTPLPIGNFVEGRMAVTVACTFNYLNKYRFKLSYTNFFAARNALLRYNLINDRDFASVTASYSF